MEREVRYERMRPVEIREAREDCPVVYIPLGTLEWHGLHNPVGHDAERAVAAMREPHVPASWVYFLFV